MWGNIMQLFSVKKTLGDSEMSNQQPEPRRIYESIIVPFVWLVFLALWLSYYASSFSILQNIGVVLISFAVAGVIEVIVWVPWAMKHADQG
jgi:phosphate starvation-inducible membrane PsiE